MITLSSLHSTSPNHAETLRGEGNETPLENKILFTKLFEALKNEDQKIFLSYPLSTIKANGTHRVTKDEKIHLREMLSTFLHRSQEKNDLSKSKDHSKEDTPKLYQILQSLVESAKAPKPSYRQMAKDKSYNNAQNGERSSLRSDERNIESSSHLFHRTKIHESTKKILDLFETEQHLTKLKNAKESRTLITLAKKFGIEIKKMVFEEFDESKGHEKPLAFKRQLSSDTKKHLRPTLSLSAARILEHRSKGASKKIDLEEVDTLSLKTSDASTSLLLKKHPRAAIFNHLLSQVEDHNLSLENLQTKKRDFSIEMAMETLKKEPSLKENGHASIKQKGLGKLLEKLHKQESSGKIDQHPIIETERAPKSLNHEHLDEVVSMEEIENPSHPNIEGDHRKSLLEQKVVDAKETIRHFARTLQAQVENYKPPFSRMQLSLDPKELGSVEVTLVSRGNQLHIQIHSNPTAIGIMATQGQELKSQLVSMGFTDVQMQFNMQQQQRHNQGHRNQQQGKEYLKMEEIPDFYESIDMIVPQYV